jgi:hypothetical protein
MAAIEAITFAVAAGFAAVLAATILVVIGVRREERWLTFERRRAPGAIARLARIIVGRYVRIENDDLDRPQDRCAGHPRKTDSTCR